MRIEIIEENKDQIEEVLSLANGRSKSHAITSFSVVQEIAELGDEKLGSFCFDAKRLSEGAQFVFRPSGPSARSYKYSVNTTEVVLEKGSKGEWFLIRVRKATAYPRQGQLSRLLRSDTQKMDVRV